LSGEATREYIQPSEGFKPSEGYQQRLLRRLFVSLKTSQWQLSFRVFNEHLASSIEHRYQLRHPQPSFEHRYPKMSYFSQTPSDSPRHEGVAQDSEAGGRPSGRARTAYAILQMAHFKLQIEKFEIEN